MTTQNLKDDAALQTLSRDVAQYSASTKITTAAEYQLAGERLRSVKGALKQIEDKRLEYTAPINVTLRKINADAKEMSQPWLNAESNIKRAMIDYNNEQDRIRKEEQRKADAEAQKQREKLQQQAARAEDAGKTDKADQLQERAASIVAPIIQAATPKIAGTSVRETWKFEITDPAQIPREYLLVDESKIRRVVAAMKGDTNIPGIRAYPEKQLAAGAA